MKLLKKLFKSAICIALAVILVVSFINILMINSTKNNILSVEEAKEIEEADCILVLGCGIIEDRPGKMLQDRLDKSIELYNENCAPKILMSGDNGSREHNEVGVMKNYALENNVPSCDIFMDHAGFSTYESIYRAKEIFEADRIIIVTQRYHLYRALYIAKAFGIEAYGVPAKDITYYGQVSRDIREVLARTKDFFTSVFKPEPTYLGEVISLLGDGNITN